MELDPTMLLTAAQKREIGKALTKKMLDQIEIMPIKKGKPADFSPLIQRLIAEFFDDSDSLFDALERAGLAKIMAKAITQHMADALK